MDQPKNMVANLWEIQQSEKSVVNEVLSAAKTLRSFGMVEDLPAVDCIKAQLQHMTLVL